MQRVLIAVFLFLGAALAQEKQPVKSDPDSFQPEVQVRKLWEAFKQKDKATLSAMLDDGFRQFEEGLSTFGDQKTECSGRVRTSQLYPERFHGETDRTECRGGYLHRAV